MENRLHRKQFSASRDIRDQREGGLIVLVFDGKFIDDEFVETIYDGHLSTCHGTRSSIYKVTRLFIVVLSSSPYDSYAGFYNFLTCAKYARNDFPRYII